MTTSRPKHYGYSQMCFMTFEFSLKFQKWYLNLNWSLLFTSFRINSSSLYIVLKVRCCWFIYKKVLVKPLRVQFGFSKVTWLTSNQSYRVLGWQSPLVEFLCNFKEYFLISRLALILWQKMEKNGCARYVLGSVFQIWCLITLNKLLGGQRPQSPLAVTVYKLLRIFLFSQ